MVRPLARFPDRFSLRRGGAPTEGGQRRSGAGRGSAKQRGAGRRSLGLELLESRQLLAVTAALVGAELQVTLDAADDQAFLESDGSSYIVYGTGLAAEQFDLAKVDSISVADAGAFANQSFTVKAGSPIVDRLVVDKGVEITTINGALDIGTTDPGLSIGSPAIALAADVTTQGGGQVYGGAVTIAGNLTLTSSAGAVNFQDTVDSYAGVSFAPQAEFATGDGARSVAIGDINGDGLQDLAIANGSSSSVSVLLNTTPSGATTPSYAPQVAFAAGSNPSSVSIGDFNGDGKPDLAIANNGSDSVSVLLNTTAPGDPTPSFAPQVEFATGSNPQSVSIGDFNGDGKPDLAIANLGSNSVSVLLNTTATSATTPTFAPQAEFVTGIFPDSVSVGDFDGDGKPDLAVANNGSDSVSVLLNTTAPGDPTPSFAPQVEFTTGSNPASVSVGDINGDALPDLAIANTFSDTVSVLLNTTAPGDPAPSFAPQAEFATGGGPRSVAIGDLNDDGKPDLAIANTFSDTVSVLLNATAPGDPTPSFTPQAEFVTGSGPQAVAIDDLNDDGKFDLATANAGEGYNAVNVLLNTTQPGALTVSSSAGTTFKKSVGGISPLLSLDVVAGTTSLWADVTTTLTQSYSGAVALEADAKLTGTTITTGSTVDGGSHTLTVTGDAVVKGAISGVTDYSVSGTTSLGANVTTSGTQTYTGLITLAADATLTGTNPTLTAGVAGKGKSLVLDFSGTTAIDGALFNDLKNLSTGNGGTTTLTGAITTTGTQVYADKITLLADTTLKGTTITTGSTLFGAAHALSITGDAVVKGAISGVTNYLVSGTTSLGADVTTTGTQTYTGAVTLTVDTTLTGTTITNESTIDGVGQALAITGNAVVKGVISGVTNFAVSGTTDLGADVTTTGTQSYGGDVVLTKSVALESTGGKDVTFGKAIGSASGLATSLIATTAGTIRLAGNVGGSLGGAAALGSLAIQGGEIVIGASLINTSGAAGQTYDGNVRLAADVWLNSGVAITAAPVIFRKAVDSLTAGSAVNLAVNASGRTLFGGVVGGTNPLSNLWTNPGFGRADTGVTRFDATTAPPQATIRTVGSQVYADDVVLGKNVVLVSTGNAGISFGRTVTSVGGAASALEIVTTGTTTFDGNVGGALGGAAVLGALKTGTGPTRIRSALVNTSGADGQVYRGSVVLVADVWINSGNAATAGLVTFSSSVSSQPSGAAPFNLAVNASGPTTFAGAVGGVKPLRPLRNLWTNPGYGRTDAGQTLFTGVPVPGKPTVLTLGSQIYADDVLLTQDTLFQSSAGGGVTFSKTVQANGSPVALAINTTGTTTFSAAVGGAIGGSAALRSLDVMTGPTVLGAPLVNTSGTAGQSYAGAVTLKASSWIESGTGPVRFRSTLDSLAGAPTSLAINASGDTKFAGPVGKLAPLSSLSTAAGAGQSVAGTTYVDGGLVATVGDGGQSYVDRVVLGADASFTSGPKGAIVFHDTLDGTARATFSAAGGALIFFQKVGGGTPLRGISIPSASSVYAAQSVVLDGTNKAAAQDGLVIGAGVNSVTIAAAGNSVAGFRGTGIVLAGGSTNSLLAGFDVKSSGADGIAIRAGDYSGTRLQGNSISGSARAGLILDPAGGSLTNLLFGGGAGSQGNSLSANGVSGIETTAGSLSGVTIAGNTIARNGDRVSHTGNGILVRGSNLLIGWDTAPFPALPAPVPSNTITENGLNGIEIAAGAGNSILSNAIYKNGAATDSGAIGKGIALGVTTSGNDGQPAPEIRKVVWDRASDTVRVEVFVPADGRYFVQLFKNLPEDERGVPPIDRFGFEGRNLIAPVRAGQPVAAGKPALSGNGVIVGNSLATFEIPATSLAAGDWLTATATKLAATTPGSTSEFSKGVQVVAYPALAVGGDSFGTTWNPEYAYTPSPSVPGSIRVSNLTPTQLNVLQSVGTELTFTSTATSTDVVLAKIKDAKPVVGLVGALDIQLDGPPPWSSGIFVLGWSSLPAARLYDTSTAAVIRDIGRTEITAALSLPIPGPTATPTTIPAALRNAFVARFQGGIRVASADFDGDGYLDIVTVPGGAAVVAGTPLPGANPPTAAEFGDTLRVVTIFNGNPSAAARAWESASFNVGGMFNANFSLTDAGTYAGGFIVTTGDVLAESSGSRNAVTELIVASTATASPRRVVVLDVTVGARGERPVIVATQDRFDVAAPITGLATGAFTNPRGRADILVATTTGKPSDWQSQSPLANTAAVTIYAPPVSRDPATNGFQSGPAKQFFINSFMENGPPGAGFIQNAFLYGATLAVGDIDDDVRGLPELVLGAGRMGLSNFRAIPYDAVVSGLQSGIDRELSKTGTFSMPNPRPGRATGWQPGALGGPDFYAGENVPMPFGAGLNAQLDVAVVEPNGRNFRAEVFAALGGANQTGNEIRAFNWAGSNTWRKETALTLKVVEMDRNRLHDGEGLRLG